MVMVIINNNTRLNIIISDCNSKIASRRLVNWRLELCRDACAKSMINVGDYK